MAGCHRYAEKAVKLNSQNKEANLILGQINFLNKDYEQAYGNLEKFLENNGDNVDAYITLVKVLIAQNKKEEAEDLAQKSFLLYPDNPKITYNRSLVWFLTG